MWQQFSAVDASFQPNSWLIGMVRCVSPDLELTTVLDGMLLTTCRYERSYPTYNYSSNACGIVHITIGCGGKPGSPADALDNEPIEAGESSSACRAVRAMHVVHCMRLADIRLIAQH
jgi:hypothetical protein